MDPGIPIKYENLKVWCRMGLSDVAIRRRWWPLLAQLNKGDNVDEYPDIIGSAERLLVLLSKPHLGLPINECQLLSDADKLGELFNLFRRNSGVQCPELMYSILAILSDTIPRIDICHLIGCDLLANETKFGKVSTVSDHKCRLFTFRRLLQGFMPRTFEVLNELGALDGMYLNLMFVDFFRTLLPRRALHRMVDCYLLEGSRILYRYGLGLMKGYKSLVKKGELRNAWHFWYTIQMDAASIVDFTWLKPGMDGGTDGDPGYFMGDAEHAPTKIEMSAAYKFLSGGIHDDSFDRCRPALRKLYRPMKVSSKTINKLMLRAVVEFGQQVLSSPLESPLLPPQMKNSPSNKRLYLAGDGSSSGRGSSGTMPNAMMIPLSPSYSAIGHLLDTERKGGERGRERGREERTVFLATPPVPPSREHPAHPPADLQQQRQQQQQQQQQQQHSIFSSPSKTHLFAAQSEILDSNTAPQILMLCPFDYDYDIPLPHPLPLSLPQPSYSSSTTPTNKNKDKDMPQRLHLLFSTARDGWDLQSLYERVHTIYPVVILIKALGASSIIGAFMSAPLSPQSTSVKGDGRCFCFRLDTTSNNGSLRSSYGLLQKNKTKTNTGSSKISPPYMGIGVEEGEEGEEGEEEEHAQSLHYEPAKFPWVGLRSRPPAATSEKSSSKGSDSSSSPHIERHHSRGTFAAGLLGGGKKNSQQQLQQQPTATTTAVAAAAITQFAVCTSSYISFGGSEAYCTNAIRLDDDLRTCSSGPSDTYGNEYSLFIDENGEQQSVAFSVENVEVFCTRSAYESAFRDAKDSKRAHI